MLGGINFSAKSSLPTSFIVQKGEKAKETYSSSLDKVAFLNKQAQMLRAEANSLQRAVNETKAARLAKAERKLDTWIDDLFVNLTINDSTQIINTVEEVARVLVEGRYSPEQLDKVFQRLCQTDQVDSPMMELLADATNEVDVLQRDDHIFVSFCCTISKEFGFRFALACGRDG
mmetsp:Transcript_13279/g.19530  ORF Transcript_13279/g.19530 Transcript_13279/m.19530 type:complete len:174 (-) Transcript_13279:1371-1892(-)